MLVKQAFRFELDPNKQQYIALAKHVGTARFAYNWGLNRCLKALERNEKIPSAYDLHKEWNQWKRENAPWWKEVSKCAPQEAFRDLERAFKNWKAKLAKKPHFKRKKFLNDNKARFTGSIRVFERYIQLPRIGKVRTKEKTVKLLSFLEEGKVRILSATVSREADRWYVSLSCEVQRPDPPKRTGEPVGIDVGLCSFITLSDGTKINAPKPLAKALYLLKWRSRQLSRKQKGSKNYIKAALKVAKVHRRVKNIRHDFLHNVTTWLAKTKPAIVIEDLNVKRLSQSYLARAVADVGWRTFRQMLEYKCEWYGAKLITADCWFPSTKKCSCCGHVEKEVPLSQRTFVCPECGFQIDRDINAALNLKQYGMAHLISPTGSSPGSDACGDRLCGGTAIWSVYEHPVVEAGSPA